MTWSCPKCGTACLSEAAAAAHCAKQTCPDCQGKKIIPGGFGYPSMTCPTCKGSGKI